MTSLPPGQHSLHDLHYWVGYVTSDWSDEILRLADRP